MTVDTANQVLLRFGQANLALLDAQLSLRADPAGNRVFGQLLANLRHLAETIEEHIESECGFSLRNG